MSEWRRLAIVLVVYVSLIVIEYTVEFFLSDWWADGVFAVAFLLAFYAYLEERNAR